VGRAISGGERWDEVIECEITASRCVVVVWTPRSFNRKWVHLEAHHGRKRGILAPILIGVDEPPFAFSLIEARNLSGWNGASRTTAVRLGNAAITPASIACTAAASTRRRWRMTSLGTAFLHASQWRDWMARRPRRQGPDIDRRPGPEMPRESDLTAPARVPPMRSP
jgi:hypothetical protein